MKSTLYLGEEISLPRWKVIKGQASDLVCEMIYVSVLMCFNCNVEITFLLLKIKSSIKKEILSPINLFF